MNRIYILGLAAILGLSACGESAQEKLARIKLQKEKSAKIMQDSHYKYTSCLSSSAIAGTSREQCKSLELEYDEIKKIEDEKINKLMQE
jgi:hypothetical protein